MIHFDGNIYFLTLQKTEKPAGKRHPGITKTESLTEKPVPLNHSRETG